MTQDSVIELIRTIAPDQFWFKIDGVNHVLIRRNGDDQWLLYQTDGDNFLTTEPPAPMKQANHPELFARLWAIVRLLA